MTVAVIGGGFSGAMTALHLAARGIETTIVEPGPLGRGVAYAETGSELLLNTPSAAMSAFPDRPDDFAAWLAARGDAATFAPRALYGTYIAERIANAGFAVVAARARRVARTARGFAIACEDGRRLAARAIVCALGNAPPRKPDVEIPGEHYLADPYRAAAAIERDAPVVLLGTGLTAFDVICSLRLAGHRGAILAVSRRGLTPHAFAPSQTAVVVPRELVRQPRLATLLAWWRSRWLYDIGDAAIAAALRPVMPLIWRRLPNADRERFVRHVRPRWEVVRHRAPPQVAAIVDEARASGALQIAAGRLVATARVGALVRCTFVTPKKTMLVRDVRHVINCTGPERDVTRQTSPLVRSLLDAQLIDPDPLRLGVQATNEGQLIGAAGPVPRAFAVGPWRIADAWESTAVPELRVQAADTAAALERELSRAASAA